MGASSSYDENFNALNIINKSGNPWLSRGSNSSGAAADAEVVSSCKEVVVFGFGTCMELSSLRIHTPPNGWPGAEPSHLILQVFVHSYFFTYICVQHVYMYVLFDEHILNFVYLVLGVYF